MTCSNCACFDVCQKLLQMCKSMVYGNTHNLGLIKIMASQCSTYTPKKIKYNKSNTTNQPSLIGDN